MAATPPSPDPSLQPRSLSSLRLPCPSRCQTGSSASGYSELVPPMNIQDRFPLGLTGWIFLQSKGLSTVGSDPMGHSSSQGAPLKPWPLPSPLLISTGVSIPLRGLEGIAGLPGASQDEAVRTRKFEMSHGCGGTC